MINFATDTRSSRTKFCRLFPSSTIKKQIQMNATITLDRLRFFAHHGVMAQERKVGNDFEVTVTVTYDASEAAETDDITAAINYAEIVEEVRRVMEHPSALLEHVAWQIRRSLSRRFPQIKGGRVKVTKVSPPIPAVELNGVSLEIQW